MSATRNIGRLMGLVPTDTAEQELSLRQRLRTAISAAAAARAELEMIASTSAFNGEAAKAIEAAEAALEQSKATLAASKLGTAKAFVARAMGTAEGSGIPIAQARLELQVSEDELEAAVAARQALKDLIPEATDKLYWAEHRVQEAVEAVIISEISPHAQRIWEEHARISRTARELDHVVEYLKFRKAIGSSHLPIPAVNAYDGAQVWREAEKALQTDADARLPAFPGIGGTLGTPQKR